LKENEELVDADLFNLLGRLRETASVSGDQESGTQLDEIQQLLIENTEFGRQVKQQTEEVEAAVKSLQDAGQELTRDVLLDLVIDAPNDVRLSALVSLARPGMDYSFFQMLTERIDRTDGDEKERLIALREKLLDLTRQIDQELEARSGQARQLLNQVLQADDVNEAIQNIAPQIDEFFLQAVQETLDEARNSGDLEKINKLNQINDVIREGENHTRILPDAVWLNSSGDGFGSGP
jgi:hypothetical protein